MEARVSYRKEREKVRLVAEKREAMTTREKERDRERGPGEMCTCTRWSEKDGQRQRALEIWSGDRSGGFCAVHATLNASQPRPCHSSFARLA